MAKKRRPIDFGIANPDDLFSTQEERDEAKLKKIYEVSLDEIDPFPEHPFKVKDDEDMMNLVESVKANGIITPATLRKKEDGRYEIISGHRRKRACELAGLTTLRSEIVDMTRDEATIFMVESNFQRTTILPSEKAFAYKMRLEAMKRQAGRLSKENVSPVATDLRGKRSDEMLGEMIGEGKDNVRRYIRLTELNPALLDMVDDGQIALRPAVELSYLPKEQQKDLCESIEMEQCTPTHAQAIRMRKMSEAGKLTPEAIEAIMLEEKPNQKERIVLRGDRFGKLFPKDLPVSKREDFVAAAMEYYGKYLSRKDRENER
ncbi:ParB/RepB/Spo0J family partition protein [Aminicella lysinilytica]|uniref:ParB family chromosome partitioning protein n=1 Tax=Aminicella lysinilytica TaxID=433323 RepID=A0A4R6Q0F1_9FIRM|nr:ParB/RepB/Spo0J family partition protein [Aminicella lysinilytica]TDP46659.1 ParB family chromosome partitioning protein [Aminicella lysinilytica]